MTSTSESRAIQLYFDFLCPYAWRGVELADVLRREHGLHFELRHFSLVQGNHPENPDRKAPQWWLTDQAAEGGSEAQQGSLAAFLAAQAAMRQGEEAGWRFALALLRARHQQKAELHRPDVLQQVAEAAGLELPTFQQDLQDDAGLRAALRQDLQDSAALGVFGTPTFQLPEGGAAYFRYANLVTDPAQALALWQLYTSVLSDDARIETIKRPR
ncbi:DsbA family oxidoreductase [Deinococcus sonorensis]|uniref:DsbA family protein n=2 Tax=Deinococcus sonorensis TaxID=309891 RepID=A0AAU7UC72_9DEIO